MTDAEIVDRLRALCTGGPGGRPAPEILYGRRKMTDWLNRGLAAAGAAPTSKHTVDRLMRQLGMRGLVRGRGVRTTVPAGDGRRRAADLLQRRFGTSAPNLAWVTGLHLRGDLGRVRLRRVRRRPVLPGDRGLVGRHRQGRRVRRGVPADGAVAA